MSNLVLQNDALVFGAQSPFYKYISEPGVRENLFRYILDKNSNTLIKRAFRTYILGNKIFPNNVIEINEYVKHGLSQLVTPFIGYSVKNSVDSVMKVSKQKYSQGEIALTNELSKATKVKNLVAVIMDSKNESGTESHTGIVTYINKKISTSGTSEIIPTWDNKFFSFENPSDISIIVAIPKNYLAHLMTVEYGNFTNDSTIGNGMDSVLFKGNVVEKLTIDLIKSFFAAIFSDCYRNRILGDIYNLEVIFKNEGNSLYIKDYKDEISKQAELNAKYSTIFKKFKSNASENLIYYLLDYVRFNTGIIINPQELYEGFIDVPKTQLDLIYNKIPAFSRFTKNDVRVFLYNFTNNLKDMNKFYVDSDRDIVIYAEKLVRYLPVAIFCVYVLGNGADHSKIVTLTSNIRKIIPTLKNLKSSSIIFGNICDALIDELNFILEVMLPDFSSPTSVTSASRFMITKAISIFGTMQEGDNDEFKNNSEQID